MYKENFLETHTPFTSIIWIWAPSQANCLRRLNTVGESDLSIGGGGGWNKPPTAQTQNLGPQLLAKVLDSISSQTLQHLAWDSLFFRCVGRPQSNWEAVASCTCKRLSTALVGGYHKKKWKVNCTRWRDCAESASALRVDFGKGPANH